ncbi:MAG: hypothetical protein NT007_10325 [Candidatus Kapabacteria bacterium]|nr:hypothetical protein [Candidatus Kapabacteria bacterium]
MKMNLLLSKYKTIFFIALFLGMSILPEFTFSKGSFGGSRGGGGRSFGGSRSYSAPKSSAPSPRSSFNNPSSRSTAPATGGSSFGGNRSMSSSPAYNNHYTSKYGAPRKSLAPGSVSGVRGNYVIHQYGGFTDGLMMGYMMGYRPWYWHTPFHPAFYYSSPTYINNPDGTVSAYPPTFSFGNVILSIVLIIALVVIIRWVFRKIFGRSGGSSNYSQSSFS